MSSTGETLKQLNGRGLDAGRITLGAGGTYTLPDGKGTISFDGVKRYIGMDIRSTPGQTAVLTFAFLPVAGLTVSPYIDRRRAWVRAGTQKRQPHVVECGLLARGEEHRLATEAAAFRELLSHHWRPNVHRVIPPPPASLPPA